jgi:hypothetical protein
MRKTTIFILIVFLASSCNKKQDNKAVRIYAEFEVLNNEFNYQGHELFVINDKIVLCNFKDPQNFLYVFNKENGEKLFSTGKIGYGVNEYASPFVVKNKWNNYLFVYDLMGKTKQYFAVDSLKNNNDGFIKFSRKEDSIIRAKGYDIRLEEDLYIAFNSKKEDAPYRVYNNGLEKNFGEYILKNEKEHFYPATLYNPDKKLLVMSSGILDYLCCYKKEGDNFKLKWEKRHHYVYGKHNGSIVFDNSRVGSHGMTLTKDFIVTIQRDYENDRTSETAAMKDPKLLPQTVFVYDYDGTLRKIINYQTPISKICGNENSNDIYAIFGAPDFKFGVTSIE